MINIGNSSIENILVGDTLVDKVYLGTDIVWEHSLPVVTKNYLKFTALEGGTFTLTIPQFVNTNKFASVSYSLDNGVTWVTTQNVSGQSVVVTTPTVAQGGTVLWKGSGISMADSGNASSFSKFSSSGDFSASGNIMSLLYDDFESRTTLESNYTFYRLFDSSKVTTSPELPSTGLRPYCYGGMFMYCSKLTIPPELPATTLATGCYQSMFYYCISLLTAPELPATTLESNCYKELFSYCRLVNYIKAMFTTTPSNSYTQNWVQGVASTGTFAKNVEATWDVRGNNGIPTNWTVETVVRNYLKFTALESCTFTLTVPTNVNTTHIASISYSLDNGATWVTTLNSSSVVTITTPTVALGGTVLWKGSGIRTAIGSNNNQYSLFSSTANFAASGNIMSLLYEDTFENQLIMSEPYCFGSLFKGCSKITTAPELPATTLAGHCYENMFLNCTALTAAPGLPATTLAGYCYSAMFGNCSSLATAPTILPATTLSEFCYNYMFSGCSSLIIAPELPATILVSSCYRFMFNNCRALTRITCLATDISASLCVDRWVQNVNSNAGTFVKNENMSSWPTGSSGIPTNWTVVDYNS